MRDPPAWGPLPICALRGQPFKLGAWQRKFIEDALQPGVREVGYPTWRGIVASMTGAAPAESTVTLQLSF